MTDDEVEAVARALGKEWELRPDLRRWRFSKWKFIARAAITALDAHRSTTHRHCSAGCEKSIGKLVCAKCGADFTECNPDECVL